MSSWTKCLTLILAVVFVNPPCSRVLAGAALPPITPVVASANLRDQEAGRLQVAEGEYSTSQDGNEGGIGAYAPGVYNFRESWTLWKLQDGSFTVEGERQYESPRGEEHKNAFSVHLAADFRASGVKEFRKLKWRQDSGPLTCDFLPAHLACTSGAKDPREAIDLNMPMRDAYGFLWPISAFSLSNITRGAARISGKLTPVQLVTVEELSEADPVYVSTLDGHLKYLGQEEILQAGKKWRADKFELKVSLHLPFVIWTSPQGLLLAFAPESAAEAQPQSGLRLVHFQQSADF